MIPCLQHAASIEGCKNPIHFYFWHSGTMHEGYAGSSLYAGLSWIIQWALLQAKISGALGHSLHTTSRSEEAFHLKGKERIFHYAWDKGILFSNLELFLFFYWRYSRGSPSIRFKAKGLSLSNKSWIHNHFESLQFMSFQCTRLHCSN